MKTLLAITLSLNLNTTPTLNEVYNYLIEIDVKHPKIVLAQVIQESGPFTSNAYVNDCNLFALTKGGRSKGLQDFEDWKECCREYKRQIQDRYYKGGDYYDFLECLWKHSNGDCAAYSKDDPDYTNNLRKSVAHFKK